MTIVATRERVHPATDSRKRINPDRQTISKALSWVLNPTIITVIHPIFNAPVHLKTEIKIQVQNNAMPIDKKDL